MAMSSGPAKHRMCADAAPDDVRLAGLNLVSVLEGCAAIRRPSHLPHTWVSLHPLDAQPWMEILATARNVGDELSYRLAESSLLLWSEPVPITPE